MVDTVKKNYVPDARLLKIRTAIAHKLQIPLDDVTVKVAHDPDAKDKRTEYAYMPGEQPVQDNTKTLPLTITIHKEGMALEFERYKDAFRTSLGEMQPFAKYSQMVPDEKLSVQIASKIRAAAEGTNFNMKLVDESPVFDPKIISQGYEVGPFALSNVRQSAYGTEMTLHFAHKKGEDISAAVERFAELTRGRLQAIQEIWLERALKYAKINLTDRGLNAQEKDEITKQATAAGQNAEEALSKALETKIAAAQDKIRADMAKLIVKVNIDTENSANLIITARSPEQDKLYNEALKTKNKYQVESTPPENADALCNSSPLTSHEVGLTTEMIPGIDGKPPVQPQLRKLLARGLLFDKDKNVAPDALKIMGREDIKAAIATDIMKNVLPKHPEKRAAFEEILNSDLFKNHSAWYGTPGTPGNAKPEPQFSEPRSDDTMEIVFNFPTDANPEKNQLLQVVNGLAGLPMNSYKTSAPSVEDVSTANPKPDSVAPKEPTAAGAVAAIACQPNKLAVAGAGAGVDANGNAIAGAGGACVNPETKEVTAATGAVAAQTPEAAVAAALDVQKPDITIGKNVFEAKPVAARALNPHDLIEGFAKKVKQEGLTGSYGQPLL